jgi:hypothetical protein
MTGLKNRLGKRVPWGLLASECKVPDEVERKEDGNCSSALR